MIFLYCTVSGFILHQMNTLKLLLQVLLICLSTGSLVAQVTNGWLGPERSGIYKESGLLKSWPPEGPELIWETKDIGTGLSSATSCEDAVYITGKRGENDVLTAFTQDGKKKWEIPYGKSVTTNYPDSRGTSTVAYGKIYIVSGSGDMVCISREGKILWTVNYFQRYKGVIPEYGISENPLVADNKVIGTPGGKIAAMVAFNAENGNVVWETASIDDETQYVNPVLIEFGGKKLIITHSAKYVFAVDLQTGKLQWKFDYMAECKDPEWRFAHISTPLFRDGYLFVSSGYNKVAMKLKLNTDGSVPTIVWKNNDLDPHVGGAILLGDYLYGSNWETSSYGKWLCVDWKTGKTLWMTDWYNKGSLIAADGMLFLYEEKNGHVGLVKPDQGKLNVVSEFKITKGTGPFWAYPVIDRGRLFLRHGAYLAVYSIK
jgi:outer membrane protein assembly factor BamB